MFPRGAVRVGSLQRYLPRGLRLHDEPQRRSQPRLDSARRTLPPPVSRAAARTMPSATVTMAEGTSATSVVRDGTAQGRQPGLA